MVCESVTIANARWVGGQGKRNVTQMLSPSKYPYTTAVSSLICGRRIMPKNRKIGFDN